MWFMTRFYTASEAEKMGLINTVVPLENLEKETVKWCREILRNSPTAIRVLKYALNADDDGGLGRKRRMKRCGGWSPATNLAEGCNQKSRLASFRWIVTDFMKEEKRRKQMDLFNTEKARKRGSIGSIHGFLSRA